MTVVIRPSPAVFKRATPLLVIFGAYRVFDTNVVLEPDEGARLAQMVAAARRYRVPLAFARRVNEDGSSMPGHWLPSCRPRIRDMVFDHREPSTFSNHELARTLQLCSYRGITFAGPHSDSDLHQTLKAAADHNFAISVVDLADTLQICSTTQHNRRCSTDFSSWVDQSLVTPYSKWIRTLRYVDDIE